MNPYTDPSTFPVNLTTLRDGDRVRATFRGDGLVVEGIVEGATDRPGGHRKIKGFDRRLARARSIEVLEKAPEPLPTKPASPSDGGGNRGVEPNPSAEGA